MLLQAFPFLDAEMHPTLQAVGVGNMVQPEGVVSYTEIAEKSKWSVYH